MPAHAQASAGLLSIFSPSIGRRDTTAGRPIAIEEIQPLINTQEAQIRFNIVNRLSERRSSGFVFVVLKAGNNYTVWPTNGAGADMHYRFNQGEFFSTARFRPVYASFPPVGSGTPTLFHIVIFSTTGDVLYQGPTGR